MTRQMSDYFHKQEEICRSNDAIAPRLYDEYGVNKGLRDENGKGVLTGLTNISKIVSSKVIDGKKSPCDGELWYRGYRVETLINSLGPEEMGFEKIAYLLLMGEMPDDETLRDFVDLIWQMPHPADQLYQRCYNESVKQGYNEFHDQEHTDSCFL